MEEKVGRVYCIINKVNGKLYVGQTSRKLKNRLQSHIYDANMGNSKMFLHRAIRKYGVSNFLMFLVWEGNLELINTKEIHYIELFNSKIPNGYNVNEGGKGQRGFSFSLESKQKISKSNKGKKCSEELKIRYSIEYKGKGNPNYGKKHTKETIEKIIKANLGKVISEETRLKYKLHSKGKNNPNYGNHLSEEAKERISKANRDNTVYNFYHPEHGAITCIPSVLYKTFNLTRSNVKLLTSKKIKVYKKWIILTD